MTELIINIGLSYVMGMAVGVLVTLVATKGKK